MHAESLSTHHNVLILNKPSHRHSILAYTKEEEPVSPIFIELDMICIINIKIFDTYRPPLISSDLVGSGVYF